MRRWRRQRWRPRRPARQHFGKLDILVNNAGGAPFAQLTETDAATWDAVAGLNARGSFLHARKAVKVMLEGDGAVIVQVGSTSGLIGLGDAAYTPSKAAAQHLMRTIAVDYGKRRIRANAVVPGVIETDIMEGLVPGRS
jgi:hypothetical protein